MSLNPSDNAVVQYSEVPLHGIELSAAATQRVLSYLAQHHHLYLRLSVKKTGCSGLSYVMDYVDAPCKDDIVFSLEEPYAICVDKSSYPVLKGLKMDYVTQGLNTKFVFQNPNQSGACGCGESFTVEQ